MKRRTGRSRAGDGEFVSKPRRTLHRRRLPAAQPNQRIQHRSPGLEQGMGSGHAPCPLAAVNCFQGQGALSDSSTDADPSGWAGTAADGQVRRSQTIRIATSEGDTPEMRAA